MSKEDTIRAFVAITLPDEVKKGLEQVSEALALQLPGGSVRWVRPDRMHLTLRFLGDTAVSLLPELKKSLDIVSQIPSFNLQLSHVGCFPNQRRPRVLWVGIQGDTDPLLSLKKQLDQQLTPLGWSLEKRPFRAHLTIGRVKDGRRLQGGDWRVAVPSVEMRVEALHLIKSQLFPQGPVYTIQHSSQLL